MKNKCRFAVYVLFVCVTCRCTSAFAQAASTDGIQQFAEFGDFKLYNGSVVHEFRLGYRTLGKLNSGKSNAVLWPTWMGGKSEDLLPFIGQEMWSIPTDISSSSSTQSATVYRIHHRTARDNHS